MERSNRRSIFGAILLSLAAIALKPRATQAVPNTFYVATDGSDATGDGSATKPWKTLAYAADNTRAGNVIHLKAGTFLETRPTKLAVGVDIEGEGTDRTIVRASLDSSYLITLLSRSHETGNQ
ncbi:MAG: hypothetical protein H7145_01050, partial [Akkermansiaceae bacterium]|nr:hypothetical protein [Armatimonadota bacterium]